MLGCPQNADAKGSFALVLANCSVFVEAAENNLQRLQAFEENRRMHRSKNNSGGVVGFSKNPRNLWMQMKGEK